MRRKKKTIKKKQKKKKIESDQRDRMERRGCSNGLRWVWYTFICEILRGNMNELTRRCKQTGEVYKIVEFHEEKVQNDNLKKTTFRIGRQTVGCGIGGGSLNIEDALLAAFVPL